MKNKNQELLENLKNYKNSFLDLVKIEKIFLSIFDKIENEKLTQNELKILLNKLQNLSPKKTGTFLEIFNRKNNNLQKAKNISHDAIDHNNFLIEIKTSRVYMNYKENKKLKENNLYEQLFNEIRVFTPFNQLFTADYDCNIQQIKTKEFERLNYCLFFENIILEFSINKSEIKKDLTLLFENFYKELERNNFLELSKEIKKEIEKEFISPNFSWKRIYNILEEKTLHNQSKIILNKSNILIEIYKKSELKYSDKQHAGNEGEGQFHINKDNILYHLAFNYKNCYTYSDFVEVLKSQKIEKTKSKIKKIKN